MNPDDLALHVTPDDLTAHQWRVVGTSFQKDYLLSLLPPDRDSDHWQYRWVRLDPVYEPDNPHDPNAISMRHEGNHVGYIDKATAVVWDRSEPLGPMGAILGTHNRLNPTLRLRSADQPCPF